RLDHDIDAWVATAGPASGAPYLGPLSFLWDGTTLLIATPPPRVTSRNPQATRPAPPRIGPPPRPAPIEGTVDAAQAATDIPPEAGDAFAAKAGFDPRELTGYLYFRIHPQRIQAWREANELEGRELMRNGRWAIP